MLKKKRDEQGVEEKEWEETFGKIKKSLRSQIGKKEEGKDVRK